MDEATANVIGSLIAQFGVLGVLVWYLLYNTKVTLPGINRENSELVSKIVSDHRATVARMTESFDANLREERVIRREEISHLTEAIREIKASAKEKP